jgi:hypothetical protein
VAATEPDAPLHAGPARPGPWSAAGTARSAVYAATILVLAVTIAVVKNVLSGH